jgi:iron complex outermembrane recepter protein
VTYIGNHRTDNWTQADDGEILGPEATYCQAVGSAGGGCFHPLINYSVDRQTSHELRFSKDTDRLKWVVGVYYLSEFDSTVQAYEPNSATQWRLIGNPDVYEGSRAAFGQATWSIIERLRLTAGVRQTEDFKQDYGFTELGPYGSINNEQCIGCKVSAINIGKGSWAKTTWHAGIDYDLTPDSLLFAAVSTGYKAGGFNVGAAPANTPYAPESLTNYELGWKSQFLQNRMQVNIDAFFDTMQNYQAAAGTLIDDTNYTLTINAGKAQIKGVELESQFLLTPYDRLTFNATALDAKFTSFYLAHGDGFSPGAQFDPYSLTGKELPYAPHTTARLGYQHTFGLGNAGSLVARADSSYVSHQWLDYHNFTDIAQDEYTRTGLSLTWERSPKFSTQLYVRNLENKAVLAGVQADSAAPGRDFNYYGKNAFYMPPRTYGVRFSASF